MVRGISHGQNSTLSEGNIHLGSAGVISELGTGGVANGKRFDSRLSLEEEEDLFKYSLDD